MPSKKNFMSEDVKHAADSFFSNTMKKVEEQTIPQPKETDISGSTPLEVNSSSEPMESMPDEAMKNETTFSITLSKKSTRDKQVNIRVNDNEYDEFTKLARARGYKNSELINLFISEFVKANK